jgi:hypothetical protein
LTNITSQIPRIASKAGSKKFYAIIICLLLFDFSYAGFDKMTPKELNRSI